MWNPEYDPPCDREACSNVSQFSSPGTRVQHSRHFTNTLPTWTVSAFNLLLGPVCNYCGKRTGIGRTNERLAGGVWTGKFTLISHQEEELTKGSACRAGTTLGPEAILWCCGQLTRKRVEQRSSGALSFPNLQSYK